VSPGADGSLWSLVVAPVLERLLDKRVFACASLPTVEGQVKVQWVDAKEALFFDIEQDTEVVIHLTDIRGMGTSYSNSCPLLPRIAENR
jgi:hypothetical protein